MDQALIQTVAILGAALVFATKTTIDMMRARKNGGNNNNNSGKIKEIKGALGVLRSQIEQLQRLVDEIRAQVPRCTAWMSEHDGRIGAWWDQQHTWNDKIEQKLEARFTQVFDRLKELETK